MRVCLFEFDCFVCLVVCFVLIDFVLFLFPWRQIEERKIKELFFLTSVLLPVIQSSSLISCLVLLSEEHDADCG